MKAEPKSIQANQNELIEIRTGLIWLAGGGFEKAFARSYRKLDAAAREEVTRVSRELAFQQLFPTLAPSLAHNLPEFLDNLDSRRGRLYQPDGVRPRKFPTRAAAAAWEDAYEAGFRGWNDGNPHLLPDCQRAWETGRAAGDEAAKGRKRRGAHSEAFLDGHAAGYYAEPVDVAWKPDRYFEAFAEREWKAGYRRGMKANGKPFARKSKASSTEQLV